MLSNKVKCDHCGVFFNTLDEDAHFCCKGCASVYQLIHESGFGHFYDLETERLGPLREKPFMERDLGWLHQSITKAKEAGNRSGLLRIVLWIERPIDEGTSWLVRELFTKQGGQQLQLDQHEGRLDVCWIIGHFDPVVFAKELQRYGILVLPAKVSSAKEDHSLKFRLGFCGAFSLGVILFSIPQYLGIEGEFAPSMLFSMLVALFATLSFVVGASYFIAPVMKAARHRRFHTDLPVAIIISITIIISYFDWANGANWLIGFDFTSGLIFLLLLWRWLRRSK
ncbi:heavy metal translocating P-type ATPase metal-binding domain-containing protein [Rubellicoccus peritrichatus]|uniref:Heavy metal translocating P-type ATPase metal-binding domain-containing protein n=1 Tax=Rubellicoccus peritrichatus TaxID=3080537 RepID=A0AAQ3L5B5_9BACT|nr:heavy metal translocating P-type ATPase metal-binding domain-containing protein [Puniceicoccus sp. CR14]WOO39689.1 heavy metal translocating P-type ATPase metal-binding domain-containing protein [Puniceicoccus sp. CR14]